MNSKLKKQEKEIEKEVQELEEVEYGLKELLHGLLIGIAFGFLIAWFLFNYI